VRRGRRTGTEPSGHVHREFLRRDIHRRRPSLQGSRRKLGDRGNDQQTSQDGGTHKVWGTPVILSPLAPPFNPASSAWAGMTGPVILVSRKDQHPVLPLAALVRDASSTRPLSSGRVERPRSTAADQNQAFVSSRLRVLPPPALEPSGPPGRMSPPNAPPAVVIFYLCLGNRLRAPCARPREMSV